MSSVSTRRRARMLLSEVCTVLSGLTLRSRLDGAPSGPLAVQQGDISPSGAYERRSVLRLDPSEYSPHHLVTTGDVLFRSRGPFWSAWAVSEADESLVAVAPLFILRPSADIDPGFLAWQLGRPSSQRYFETEAMGSGVRMITKPVLEALHLVLPSIDRQRDIAATASLAVHETQLLTHLASLKYVLTGAQLDSALLHEPSTPRRKFS